MRKGKRLQKRIFTMMMALLLMGSSLPVTEMEVQAATEADETEVVQQETKEAEPVTVSGCNYEMTDTEMTDTETIDTATADSETTLDIQYEVNYIYIDSDCARVDVTITGYDETVENNFVIAVTYEDDVLKQNNWTTVTTSTTSTSCTGSIWLSYLLENHEYEATVKVYEGTSCEEENLLDTETLTFTTKASTIDSSKLVLEAVQDENVFNKVTIRASYDDDTTNISTLNGKRLCYRKKGEDSFSACDTWSQNNDYFFKEFSELLEGDVYEFVFRVEGIQKVLEYTVTNTTFTYTVDAFVQPQSIVFTMDLYGDNLSAYTNTYMYGSAYYKDENGEWVAEGGSLSYTASAATGSNPKTLTRSAGCAPGEKYEYKFVLSVPKSGGTVPLAEKYFTGTCPEYQLTLTAEGFIDYANLYYTFAKEDWMGDTFTKTTADIYYKKSSEPESAWVKNTSRYYYADTTDGDGGSISGLEANTSYDVKLVSGDYVIAQSSFTTKEDTRSLNPKITNLTYTKCSMHVQSENMENSSTLYIYPYYREKGTEEWTLHSTIRSINGNSTSTYTFEDLKEGTEYEYAFQLKPSYTSSEVKDEEVILEFTGSFETKAREDLKVTVEADTTVDTANLKIYLNEACISYDIMFYLKGENGSWYHYSTKTMYNTSNPNPYKEITVDGLMSDTEFEYAVEVKAVGDSTVFGEGNIYNVTTGSFRTEKYDVNLEITATDITDTSFTLTFTIPDAKEGMAYMAECYVYAENNRHEDGYVTVAEEYPVFTEENDYTLVVNCSNLSPGVEYYVEAYLYAEDAENAAWFGEEIKTQSIEYTVSLASKEEMSTSAYYKLSVTIPEKYTDWNVDYSPVLETENGILINSVQTYAKYCGAGTYDIEAYFNNLTADTEYKIGLSAYGCDETFNEFSFVEELEDVLHTVASDEYAGSLQAIAVKNGVNVVASLNTVITEEASLENVILYYRPQGSNEWSAVTGAAAEAKVVYMSIYGLDADESYEVAMAIPALGIVIGENVWNYSEDMEPIDSILVTPLSEYAEPTAQAEVVDYGRSAKISVTTNQNFPDLKQQLVYWEKDSEETVTTEQQKVFVADMSQTSVCNTYTLSGLKLGTEYEWKVQYLVGEEVIEEVDMTSFTTRTVTAKSFTTKALADSIEWKLTLPAEDGILWERAALYLSVQKGTEIPAYMETTGSEAGGTRITYMSYFGVDQTIEDTVTDTKVTITPEATYGYSVWFNDGVQQICIAKGTVTTPAQITEGSTEYVSDAVVTKGISYIAFSAEFDASAFANYPDGGFELTFADAEGNTLTADIQGSTYTGKIQAAIYPYTSVTASDGNSYTVADIIENATIKPFIKVSTGDDSYIKLYSPQSSIGAFEDFADLEAEITDIRLVEKVAGNTVNATIEFSNIGSKDVVRVAGLYKVKGSEDDWSLGTVSTVKGSSTADITLAENMPKDNEYEYKAIVFIGASEEMTLEEILQSGYVKDDFTSFDEEKIERSVAGCTMTGGLDYVVLYVSLKNDMKLLTDVWVDCYLAEDNTWVIGNGGGTKGEQANVSLSTLKENTEYTYVITLKNENGEILDVEEGTFCTLRRAGLAVSDGDITRDIADGSFKIRAAADSDAVIKYQAEDETIITVAADGTVTPHKAGSTRVKVYVEKTEHFVAEEILITVTITETVINPEPTATPQPTTSPQPTATPVNPEPTIAPQPTATPTDPEPTATPSQPEQTKNIVSGKFYYDIVGNGAMVKKAVSVSAQTLTIPATVKLNGKTYKVTGIAKNAFKNNKGLKKITIGKYVTSIGNNAFYGCKKLTSVKIGSNVTTIGDGAFGKCTALTKITIPSKVKTIGKSAFDSCTKLKTVTIGKNVTAIGDKAFYKCSALTKITIPSKVNKIGKSAFYNCKKLKTITIKTTKLTTKNVGTNAFKGIYSKATIKVPKSKEKAYQTLLKKKGIGKSVTVKK